MNPITKRATTAAGLAMLAGSLLLVGHNRLRGAEEAEVSRAEVMRELAELLRNDLDVDPQSILKNLPSLKQLAEDRIRISERMMEQSLLEFVATPSPTAARGTYADPLQGYLKWSNRRLNARLQLAENDDARIDLLAREVAKFREVERLYTDLAQSGTTTVTPKNLLEVEYHRLDLETRLVQITSN